VLIVRNGRWKLAKLVSIYQEGKPVERIQARKDEEVGFGTDQTCDEGATFRALPGELAMSIQESLFDAEDLPGAIETDKAEDDADAEVIEAPNGDIAGSIEDDMASG
jgi:hypothetical protein